MPDYSTERIRDVYTAAKSANLTERHALEYAWFRNCLYYMGIQWIVYNSAQRKWQPRNMKPWIPRPVTNKFGVCANSIIQALSAKPPDTRCRPGTGTPEDSAAAMIADRNLEYILREADAERARYMAAVWATLTGTAIIHPCYDNDPMHGVTEVPVYKCEACGKESHEDELEKNEESPAEMQSAMGEQGPEPLPSGPSFICPKCGTPDMVFPVTSENGKTKTEKLPNGKAKIEVFSPFEIICALETVDGQVNSLIARRRYDVDLIRRTWEDNTIEPDNSTTQGAATGQNLLRAIALAGSGASPQSNQDKDLGTVTVDQLWVKPCQDFPDGLVAIFCNDKLLNEKTVKKGIPYKRKTSSGRYEVIWPWHRVVFDEVPGRYFGRTSLDDVAPKQEQRNKLESLIQLIITRNANPVWLVPKNSGVTEITGLPGQIIEGNWAHDPRVKPDRVPGDNVPSTVMAWLEKIDADIEELSGALDVLKGGAPPGVTAGTAMRLLLERANSRFTPVLRRMEIVHERAYTDLLCIFQQFASEERINVIQGPGNVWEVKQFKGADMSGSVDVVVEAGSSVPRSIVGEQALVQDMAAMGVVNPTIPEVQYKILQRFSSTYLLGEVDENIRQAQRENWRFLNEGIPFAINPIVDNHQVHLQVHKSLALTSDYEAWPPEKKEVLDMHILEHLGMVMLPPPMMPAPGPGGPPPSKESKLDTRMPPMPGEPMGA